MADPAAVAVALQERGLPACVCGGGTEGRGPLHASTALLSTFPPLLEQRFRLVLALLSSF